MSIPWEKVALITKFQRKHNNLSNRFLKVSAKQFLEIADDVENLFKKIYDGPYEASFRVYNSHAEKQIDAKTLKESWDDTYNRAEFRIGTTHSIAGWRLICTKGSKQLRLT